MSSFGRAEVQGHQAALLLVDVARGDIVAASHGFCRLMKSHQPQTAGVPWSAFFSPSDLEILLADHLADVQTSRDDGSPARFRLRLVDTSAGDLAIVSVEDVSDLILATYTDRAISLIALAAQSAATIEEFDHLSTRALVVSGLAERAACLTLQPESRSLVLRGSVGWPAQTAERFASLSYEAVAKASDQGLILPTPDATGTGTAPNGAEPSSVLAVPLRSDTGLVGVFVLAPLDIWPAAPETHGLLDIAVQSRAFVLARQAQASRDTAADARWRVAGAAAMGIEVIARRLASLDPDQPIDAIFSELMEALNSVVPFDRALLCEEVPGRDAVFLRARYSPGEYPVLHSGSIVEIHGIPALEAIRTRQVLTTTLSADVPHRLVGLAAQAGFTKWCSAPVLLGRQTYGSLSLGRKDSDPHFSPDELRVVRTAAVAMAFYVRESRLAPRPLDHALADARARDYVHSADRARAIGDMTRRLAQILGHHTDIAVDRIEAALRHSQGAPAEPYVSAALERVLDAREAIRRLRIAGSRPGLETAAFLAVSDTVRRAVDRVLDEQKLALGDRFAAFDLDLDLGPLVSVMGDQDLLVDAFAAVLENAFQSMPRGGRVGVAVARTANWVRVLISDSGVGIAPNLWHQVFEPFFTTRGGLANGLGLSFADGVLTQHGGAIVLASDVKDGSTFALYLPAERAGAGTTPSGDE
jgi:signal transduction histidine kinase